MTITSIPTQNGTSAQAGRAVSPESIAFPVLVGRISEFFDFFVYAIASVLVFPHVFFAGEAPLQATLLSFAIFPLAFIARPFGAQVFRLIDRRYGKAVKLTGALFLLAGSTMAISFLPGSLVIGAWAPILVALFRIGQGLGWGGAWDGLASLLALSAPQKQRGWYAMMPQLGAPIGFVLASGLFIVFTTSLRSSDFLDWGWRFPFFVALAINVVALFARLRIIANPDVSALYETNELQSVGPVRLFSAHGGDIFIGALVPLASFALFHIVTVFSLSWATLYHQADPAMFLAVELGGAVIAAGTVALSGVLSDRFGRHRLLGVMAGLIGLYSFGIAPFVSAGTVPGAIFVLVGFALLGLSFGQSSGSVANRFGPRYRYSGSAMTSHIAWLLGAGFAPLVALYLSSQYGIQFAGFYLLSGAIATLVALYINARNPAPIRA